VWKDLLAGFFCISFVNVSHAFPWLCYNLFFCRVRIEFELQILHILCIDPINWVKFTMTMLYLVLIHYYQWKYAIIEHSYRNHISHNIYSRIKLCYVTCIIRVQLWERTRNVLNFEFFEFVKLKQMMFVNFDAV